MTDLLAAFSRHGLGVWVAGGWAVDAVVGRQARPHGDLDLAVDAELREVDLHDLRLLRQQAR